MGLQEPESTYVLQGRQRGVHSNSLGGIQLTEYCVYQYRGFALFLGCAIIAPHEVT